MLEVKKANEVLEKGATQDLFLAKKKKKAPAPKPKSGGKKK